MVASRTVDAKWTSEHDRTLGNEEIMYIVDALRAGDSFLQGIDYSVEEVSVKNTSNEKNVAKGACFCGQVQVELPLSVQPLFSVICHCKDCREWNMSDSVSMVLYPLKKEIGADKYSVPIQVISESSTISYVHRSPSTRRYFTTCCGTRLFFTHHDVNMQVWGLYPTLFPTCHFPTPGLEVHVRESRVRDLNLVAYSDLPVDFGGSGKLMDEALLDSKKESETGGNSDAKGKQEEN